MFIEAIVYGANSMGALLDGPRLPDAAACYTFCIAIRFEWDDEKNRINQRKHDGLAFETAALVFNDPFTLFREDALLRANSGGMQSDLLWGLCFW